MREDQKPGNDAGADDFPLLDTTGDHTIVSPIRQIDPVHIAQTPSLLMISGPQLGRSHPMLKEDFMIGRASHCDLPIEDDLVSRHHCKVIIGETKTELIDLGSTNGTLLNGRKIDRVELNEGDQIQVGSTVILKYHLQEDIEAKFLSQLYEAATRDFLTSAYNKSFFLERLRDEFHFAHRNDREVSLMVLDIDHFKRVNDSYGHVAGDEAIRKVAHYLIHHTRKDDMVARFGGEEFVILMRDIPNAKATQLAESLRQGIEKLIVKSAQHQFQLTISIGVSTLNKSNKSNFNTPESLMTEADEKLYRAKRSGRNQVCNK